MTGSAGEETLTKRTGSMQDYQSKRMSASFVFTEADRNKFGVLAIAAGVAGLGGQSVAMASNAVSVEEDADYVEFKLNGQPVSGWVWRSPFKDGDEVEVVGEMCDGVLNAVAIARPSDRTIALYPHCSRGTVTHIKNAAKWWFIGCTGMAALTLIAALFITGPSAYWMMVKESISWVILGFYIFFGLMTVSLSRNWMPFVRVAEKVFRAFDWPKPGSVDLVKSSKAQRRPEDPGEFGTFYFRY